MNCSRPVIINGGAYGCNQCTACRISKRRVWTHRILLEAAQHTDNAFVTLTFDDEHYPTDHSVKPRDIQLFMKRLRFACPSLKIRYFACGEYGDLSMRPHYHLGLFGYPSCSRGMSRFSRHSGSCCTPCDTVLKAWGQGNVTLGILEQKSAAYIAGYILKKLNKDDDPRLEGRRPEFARMSLRPGIGLGMMHDLASVLLEHKLDERMIDVPLSLQHGKKQFPLGRYLRRKLRTFIGRPENAPPEALKSMADKLQPVRDAAFKASESFASHLLKESLGKRIQLEARERRGKKRYL